MARRTTSRKATKAKRAAPKRAGARRNRAAAAARRAPAGTGHPVVHFEISARDPKALHSFYVSAFGWTIDANNPMSYGLVRTGGKNPIGGGIGGAEGGMTGVTFYVAVPDLGAALRKVGELGGRTLVPPTTIPNMVTFAMFADPQGNRIGLVKS